jgi:ABC-type dipeptide/oligopeptide/nickel transport system permease subunit
MNDPLTAPPPGSAHAIAAAPVHLDSPRRRAWRRLLRNRRAVAGGVFIALLVLASLLATWIAPYNDAAQNIEQRLRPPSAAHWLGTDEYGRDLLSRLLVGSRVSLAVGLIGVLLVVVVGVGVGLLAGYARRWDGPLMRAVDLFMSIPELLLLLLLVALFGTGTWKVALFIGISAWMATARLVRGQVLRLREREFVEASEGMGAPASWILRRHLLSNVLDVVMVQATLSISLVILLESGLSYLGLGAQPPTPSWGNMLAQGKEYLQDGWWITTFPGLAIFATVMAFNFLGDGIRDALDVRL